jgi:uncharacterized membrane protein YwzB
MKELALGTKDSIVYISIYLKLLTLVRMLWSLQADMNFDQSFMKNCLMMAVINILVPSIEMTFLCQDKWISSVNRSSFQNVTPSNSEMDLSTSLMPTSQILRACVLIALNSFFVRYRKQNSKHCSPLSHQTFHTHP